MVETVVLSCPHLMLAHVCREYRFAFSYFKKLFDYELRFHDCVAVFVGKETFADPTGNFGPPLCQFKRCDHLVHFNENRFRISHHRNINSDNF